MLNHFRIEKHIYIERQKYTSEVWFYLKEIRVIFVRISFALPLTFIFCVRTFSPNNRRQHNPDESNEPRRKLKEFVSIHVTISKILPIDAQNNLSYALSACNVNNDVFIFSISFMICNVSMVKINLKNVAHV